MGGRTSRWLLISGAVALAAIAGGAFWLLRPRPAAPRPRLAAAFPPGAEIGLNGKIRASRVVTVAAPVDGRLEDLLVEPGQPVHEGQLLGRISNSALDDAEQSAATDLERAQARVSQLETDLILARSDAARARAEAQRTQRESDRLERAYLHQQMLHKEGATPRLVFEKAAADFEAARTERDTHAEVAGAAEQRLAALAQSFDAARQALAEKTETLDAARENAAAAEIHSPVDGLLVAAARRAGEEVTTGVADLFQIATDLSALEAVVEPPPAALERIRLGQEAFVVTAEAPDAIPGRVKSVEGSVVVIEFTSPNAAVRPGGAVEVRIKLT